MRGVNSSKADGSGRTGVSDTDCAVSLLFQHFPRGTDLGNKQ